MTLHTETSWVPKARRMIFALVLAGSLQTHLSSWAQGAQIRVHANQVANTISRYLTGACIEDVNHEIYGGLYSQMIFGESFQEPAPPAPLKGFTAYGGVWRVRDGELWAEGGDGPKLICNEPALAVGEAGVELLLPKKQGGNAGLIVKVSQAGKGADKFTGYEIALESGGRLVLGRHRQNWEPIRIVPCAAPADEWIKLAVRMTEKSLEVLVDGKSILQYEDREHPLAAGQIGLRTWQREARYRGLWIKTDGREKKLAFELDSRNGFEGGVSGMWRAFRRGPAVGEFSLETANPFLGRQSQRLAFLSGEGEIGIENQSLNRWGMFFQKGKTYEGYVWVTAGPAAEVAVALESADGSQTYAETNLPISSAGWQQRDFTLVPNATDHAGRFAIKLKKPGSVIVGHAFVQPGEWGRFQGLPVRKDVTEALQAQGLTVLRYGGSMINHPEYRWKKMIGPRDRRPPSRGTWYGFSSNGWGIPDFLNFCEAAGFLGIPAFNMEETPADMADFIEYANGPANTDWGSRRASDGHPAPYQLGCLELGNEEAVNENYWQKFKPMAEAIWSKDSKIILVVGDFAYGKIIENPFSFEGGVAVKTLAAHKKILDLAREHGREVWFDIHIGTEYPPQPGGLRAERSYIEQLGKLSPGAKFKVVIFEFNAGNHALKRALANALAINQVERLGEFIPIACSANCLQPYRQNDNGWNQGLLFLTPSQVWPQPPYFITQIIARNYLPNRVQCEVESPKEALDVTAKASADGRVLTLQVVNVARTPVTAQIQLDGFQPAQALARVTTLSGQWEDINTPEEPERIKPQEISWPHALKNGVTSYSFPANSFSLIRFE